MGDIIERDVLRALPGQESFARDIEIIWNCRLVVDIRVKDGIEREDSYQPLDYIITEKHSNKVVGYMELKNRNISSDKYDTLMLDHSKLMSIRKTAFFTKLPVFVGVRYTNKDLYYKYSDLDPISICYGGRTAQKRNEYDIKQVEYIKVNQFNEFRKRN